MKDGKVCTKCGTLKPLSEYWGDNKNKDKLWALCKECAKKHQKEWRIKNREAIRSRDRNRYWQNREKRLPQMRKYHHANRERLNAYIKQWHYDNHDKDLEWKRRWWKTKSKDARFRLIESIRISIIHSLHGIKRTSIRKLLGYTYEALVVHIEKQFADGMSWSNYGNKSGQWSVDHRIPVSAFNFEKESDTDFKKCWALPNLRPMWHIENLKKGSKIDGHFQPSFAFYTNN